MSKRNYELRCLSQTVFRLLAKNQSHSQSFPAPEPTVYLSRLKGKCNDNFTFLFLSHFEGYKNDQNQMAFQPLRIPSLTVYNPQSLLFCKPHFFFTFKRYITKMLYYKIFKIFFFFGGVVIKFCFFLCCGYF